MAKDNPVTVNHFKTNGEEREKLFNELWIKCISVSEKDNTNKKAAIKLTKKLPNAQFATIEGSGHEVNIHNPKELANAIKAFLSKSNACKF